MKKTSRYVAAFALILASAAFTGCSAPEPQADPLGYEQWSETIFNDEHGRTDLAGGGGTMGTTITTNDFDAGWYAVDLVCQGSKGATFIISHDGSNLGEGTRGCGGTEFTTTTMELPAGSISSTAQSEDPNTVWQVRFRPTTAPST